MGAATSRQIPTRSRGLSDVSNISSGNAARLKYMTQPLRQPYAPPENSILQRHDGFARFLKQHASPPHHRVTAGGRIVPAGPSSPPPMLDFGSLNGLVRDRPATARSFQMESRSTKSNTRTQNPQTTSSMTLGDFLQSQDGTVGGMSLQHVAQPTSMQTNIPFNSSSFGYQPFMAPAMQMQAPILPLALFPDGSTLVSYNGMSYRASWNGSSTTIEPLQPLQLPTDQQCYPQACPQGYLNDSRYNFVPQPSQAPVLSGPLTSATNVARPDNSKVDGAFQHQAQNADELSLKTELTNLDKHLALYHYDITPADREPLIAQRRFLVEQIDKIRLSKEKPKHSIPIIAPPTTGLTVTPAVQLISGPSGLRKAVQDDRMAKGGTINKHLSPAAPAFIPRNTLNLPSTSSGMRATPEGIDSAPKAKDNVNSSTWTSHPDHQTSFPRSRRTSHNEKSSSSSVLDPSDPAMRVIDHEDIEYAARYLYNWTKDTKIFCTSVAEFQESVRRVREQARLYGCAGGQSKDPAYDAEQDLWWAICDRDPIPLPSEVPDHVTNPRAWNWNDSAFNYRRQGAIEDPGPGCEQARNSPRVVGWDPATTDKMKDVMDVSRSYFALTGQLPSVSFRDFAYDRDGNKRLIKSDTAAPSAYAYRGHSPVADSQQKGLGFSFDSSALKEVSTSELNRQHKYSALDAQFKPGDKGKIPEAIALPQGSPRTPEHRSIQRPFAASNVHPKKQASKPHLSSGDGITRSKNIETAHEAHHAYLEDHPETPVEGVTRSASRMTLTLQMNTPPSEVHVDSLPTNNLDARTESPVPASVLDSTIVPGLSWKPTEEELNSIWYHTPLDEVTQKYLDDMKAYSPFASKQADGDNYDLDAAKDSRQNSDSSEPVAESKSQWGPEESTALTTPRVQNHFELLEAQVRAEEYGVTKTAKVNIPSATNLRAPTPRTSSIDPFSTSFNGHNTIDSRDFNAVNVPRSVLRPSLYQVRAPLTSPVAWRPRILATSSARCSRAPATRLLNR